METGAGDYETSGSVLLNRHLGILTFSSEEGHLVLSLFFVLWDSPIGVNSIIRVFHYLDTLWYCFCIRSVYDVKSHMYSTSAGLVPNAC